MTGDSPDGWEVTAGKLGYDLTQPQYPTPWEPHPRMYGWRQRREYPTPEDIFQHRHLRFVAAWAVADLDDVHRRGRWKRWLVCWWAHRSAEQPPHRGCWACTARWAR